MVVVSTLMVVGSWIVPTAASADGPGRCYPPPCALAPPGAVAQAATLGSGPVVLEGSSGAASTHRSPIPDVALGLTAVIGSLTVVGLRRRMHIARRTAPEPTPRRPRPVARGERVSLG